MPVGRKLTKAEKDRLAALPRDPQAIVQGTLREVEVAGLPAEVTPARRSGSTARARCAPHS